MKIIGEIKYGSPHVGGRFKLKRALGEIVKDYVALGCPTIAVNTATAYYGNKEMLAQTREHAGDKIKIWRREGVISVDQIKESIQLGANWISVSAHMLNFNKLQELVFYIWHLGAKPIVECSSNELLRNAVGSGANSLLLINRCVKTGELKGTSGPLMAGLACMDNFEVILGGGIATPDYIQRVREFKTVDYALIGKAFMEAENLEQLKQICSSGSTPAALSSPSSPA